MYTIFHPKNNEGQAPLRRRKCTPYNNIENESRKIHVLAIWNHMEAKMDHAYF
jgi:hypothetical protein